MVMARAALSRRVRSQFGTHLVMSQSKRKKRETQGYVAQPDKRRKFV